MATNAAVREKLNKAYLDLPKNKRTEQFCKAINVIQRMIEGLVTKNAEVKIIIVVSQCEDDLNIILEQLEAVYNEGTTEVQKTKKDSQSYQGERAEARTKLPHRRLVAENRHRHLIRPTATCHAKTSSTRARK